MELQPSSSQENSKGCIVWSHDDIYSQVMGKERHGRVRGLGFGPTPKSTGSTSKSCERLRMVEEERTKDKQNHTRTKGNCANSSRGNEYNERPISLLA